MTKITCPNCNRNAAIIDKVYGVLPCRACSKAEEMGANVEFTTDSIRDQRKQMLGDIIQPFRNGHLSKEYIKKWGTKRLNVSQEEVDKAQNTWSDLTYYKDSL